MVKRSCDAGGYFVCRSVRYTGLLWALLIGYLVFDRFPDGYALLGAAVIIFSGLYMMGGKIGSIVRPSRFDRVIINVERLFEILASGSSND